MGMTEFILAWVLVIAGIVIVPVLLILGWGYFWQLIAKRRRKMRPLYKELNNKLAWRATQAVFMLFAFFSSVRYLLFRYEGESWLLAAMTTLLIWVVLYLVIRRLALYVLTGTLKSSSGKDEA